MNNDNQARRYNKGKIRYELISHIALKEVAKVYTAGAEKYSDYDEQGNKIYDGADNWRKGMPWMDVLGSAKRHIESFVSGEDIDPDLGTLHLANAAWNLMAIIEFMKTHPEYDNRKFKRITIPRIALDIDGVICEFIYPALKRAGTDNWSYSWIPSYKLNSIWGEIIEDKEFWLNLPAKVKPESLAFEPIAYVTSRPIPTEWTEEWIEKNGFPCVPVITLDNNAHMSRHASKAEALRDIKCETFIEDNYEQFVHLNQEGINCYLLDTPFNRRWDVGYKRITEINQVLPK